METSSEIKRTFSDRLVCHNEPLVEHAVDRRPDSGPVYQLNDEQVRLSTHGQTIKIKFQDSQFH